MIAHDVLEKTKNCQAVTYVGGYGMCITPRSERVLFEPAVVHSERRDKSGRVKFGVYRFSDGSVIEMSHNDTLGTRREARDQL